MIKHLVEIKNYNDACGKCKYQIKSKHGYLCGIFNEPLPTELSNKYNCRCDDCLSLGCAYDDEEVISKKLQKFIATQTTELIAQAIVWHEYPDEKPEPNGYMNRVLLVAYKTDKITAVATCEYFFPMFGIECDEFGFGKLEDGIVITHWAYLPEPPKEES